MRCIWRSIICRSSYFRAVSPTCTKFINANFKHDVCKFTTLHWYFNPISYQATNNLLKAHFSSTITDIQSDNHQHSSKLFQETENETFHDYMSKNTNYRNTIHHYKKNSAELITKEEFERIIAVKKWADEPVDKFHQSFLKVANYASNVLREPISNEQFTALTLGLKFHCERFSLKQLIEVFECLRFWPETQGTKAHNFQVAFHVLDHVCLSRRSEWDINTTLIIIDLWFGLRLTRLSSFVKKSICRFIDRPRRLSQYNIVQICFYLNTLRALPQEFSLFEMEFELDKHMDGLSVPEVGIVALGFFKSQKKIFSKTLLNKIILKLLKDVDNVDIITSASILKLMRYTGREDNTPLSMELIDRLVPKMHEFTLQTNLHLLLLCVDSNVDHYECISKFMKLFLAEPKAARLKEMEKLALAIAKFGYDSELAKKTNQTILSELKDTQRREELALHGRSFIKCVCSLAASGVYDHQLISTVLNKRLLKEYYNSKYALDMEVVALNNTLELELPNYRGDKLDPRTVSFVCKKCSLVDLSMQHRVHKESWIVMELFDTISLICQPNCHSMKYIIPHYSRPDIILNVTDDMKFRPIPPIVKDRPDYNGMIRCPSGVRLCALVCASRKMFIYGTNNLLAYHKKKLRQLALIGYLPVTIPYYEWDNLNSNDKKIDYIYKKIELSIKEDSPSVTTCESKV